MNLIVSCKAKDLISRITEEWEYQTKLIDLKEAFQNHRNYINNLSHSEYLEFKRKQNERFNGN